MPQTIYRHNRTGWIFITEPSGLPVAQVTGDMTFPLSNLNQITIPLEVFQSQISDSDEWEKLAVPQQAPPGA